MQRDCGPWRHAILLRSCFPNAKQYSPKQYFGYFHRCSPSFGPNKRKKILLPFSCFLFSVLIDCSHVQQKVSSLSFEFMPKWHLCHNNLCFAFTSQSHHTESDWNTPQPSFLKWSRSCSLHTKPWLLHQSKGTEQMGNQTRFLNHTEDGMLNKRCNLLIIVGWNIIISIVFLKLYQQ